jgi:hypothetical protein
MPDPDLNDQLRKDYQRYQKLQSVSVSDGGIATALEYTFWALAIVSVIVMLVWMFVFTPVGNKAGMHWLVGSLGSISTFAGLALVTRKLPDV